MVLKIGSTDFHIFPELELYQSYDDYTQYTSSVGRLPRLRYGYFITFTTGES
jgi:hypothetical protein